MFERREVMRRKQCEIKDIKQIEALLGRATIGRLATSGADGYPYITPVNYVWWNGSVYFHCAHEGEKIDNIRRDNRVCFEVDIPLSYLGLEYDPTRPTCHVHQLYHCVIIRGRAEIVQEIDEKVESLNALMAAHENNDDFTRVDAGTKGVGLCSVVAVKVESISGKSDLAQKMASKEKAKVAEYLKKRNLPGDAEAAEFLGG